MRRLTVPIVAVAALGAALGYRAWSGEGVSAAPAVQLAVQQAGQPAGAAPAPARGGAEGQAAATAGGGRGRGGPTPGSLLWNDRCSGCHGNDSAGGRALSLFDQKWLDATTDQAIAGTIRNGRANTEMPAFAASLSDEQVFQLIQHIRTQAGAPYRPRAQFVESPDGTIVKSARQIFKVEMVADGLMTPWALAFLPDGRLLVTERDGRLQIVDKAGKITLVTGTPKAHVQQDGGYLDVELHPRYGSNGWIYLAYVEDQPGYIAPTPAAPPVPAAEAASAAQAAGGAGRGGGGRGGAPPVPSMTVIVRGKINRDNQWTDEQTIFRASPDLYTTSGAHYGSRLLFDRDDHLFFTLGDRNNTPNRAQDLTSPLGKVHRVTDDGRAPTDNPFIDTPGAVASIWTYGHRNPEGLAWDPVTGALWESEHGPNSADEINVLVKGANYGWNVVSKQGPPQYQLSAPGMRDPAVYYTPTFAPAGITFYTGDRYPAWKNTSLFVGGLAGQALRRLDVKGEVVTNQEIVFDQFGRVRDVVQGPDGYFYLAVQNPTGVPNPAGGNISLSASTPGRIIRLVPAP